MERKKEEQTKLETTQPSENTETTDPLGTDD